MQTRHKPGGACDALGKECHCPGSLLILPSLMVFPRPLDAQEVGWVHLFCSSEFAASLFCTVLHVNTGAVSLL